jgi:amidase
VAVLKNPTDKLKNLSVKVAPMLGCVGVAPPGNQSFQSGHLGSFGGNMDYNQIREGVTLYLPVYHPGALLFVGDGHVVQGDGELTGNALETSMDVEFTVDVVEGRASDNPRAENDEYLMAMGIGGSLMEALQGATTNLAQWLERDYKLNSAEVAMLLGTSIKYDIAEIVDGQLNMAAKVPKSVLSQLRR